MGSNAETWLDIMPAIPLARAVPLRHATEHDLVDVALIGGGGRWRLAFNGWQDEADWRPDLDDPQGFEYALRWLRMNTDGLRQVLDRLGFDGLGEWRGLTGRFWCGETTDADRLALAKALLAVSQ